MLMTNMLERNSGEIKLPDLTHKQGQDLVSFLYNGHVAPDSDLVALLKAADMYDIQVKRKNSAIGQPQKCYKSLISVVVPNEFQSKSKC